MLPASIGLSSYARNAAGTCEELFDNSCRDINFNLYTMDAQTCYDDKHDCINITAASSITKLSNGKCEFPPQPQCKLSDIDTDIGFLIVLKRQEIVEICLLQGRLEDQKVTQNVFISHQLLVEKAE